MRIRITARHFDLNKQFETYIEKHIKKLDRFFNNVIEAHIILSLEKHRHITEMIIYLYNNTLRAKEEANDFYSSVDKAVDTLRRQLKKYKEKLKDYHRRGAPVSIAKFAVLYSEDSDEGDSKHQVIKTERFAVKPMSIDEAVMQIKLLNNDFLVFSNDRTNKVNVLYRRKDGNYGLIEPQV